MDIRDVIDVTYNTLVGNSVTFSKFETIEESAEKFIENYGEKNIDYRDDYGNTFLHYAIFYRNFDVCKFLLKKGASPNIKNMEGYTAMMYSILYGDCSYVHLLLEYGGDPRIKDNFGVDSFDLSNNKEVSELLFAFYST